MSETAQKLNDVLRRLDLKPADRFRPGTLEVKSEQMHDPAAVLPGLKAFAGTGWLLDAGARGVQYIGKEYAGWDSLAYPLSAEISGGSGESLHLRQDGTGGWIITRFREAPSDTDVLVQRHFVGHDSRKLFYDVCLAPCQIGKYKELRQTSARLVRIED